MNYLRKHDMIIDIHSRILFSLYQNNMSAAVASPHRLSQRYLKIIYLNQRTLLLQPRIVPAADCSN